MWQQTRQAQRLPAPQAVNAVPRFSTGVTTGSSCRGSAPQLPYSPDYEPAHMDARSFSHLFDATPRSPSRSRLGLFHVVGSGGVRFGILLRGLVFLGHVDVLDERRVVEDLTEPLVVPFTLPFGDDHRGDAVADEVGERSRLGHEAVDADDQRDAHSGDVAEGLEAG